MSEEAMSAYGTSPLRRWFNTWRACRTVDDERAAIEAVADLFLAQYGPAMQRLAELDEQMGATVTRVGPLDLQVCVPVDWNDAQLAAFANQTYPCGTTSGWLVRHQGDPALDGAPERQPCADRPGYVHIMLDA